MSGGNGFYKPQRSPLVAYSPARVQPQASGATSFEPQRRLDMSTGFNTKQPPSDSENQKLEGFITPISFCDLLARIENGSLI